MLRSTSLHLIRQLCKLIMLAPLFLLCVQCSSPCTGDGIGPLSGDPSGLRCESHCECNNQRYYGRCKEGRCDAITERPICLKQGAEEEFRIENRLLARVCPGIRGERRVRCRSHSFVRTCQAQGMKEQRWGDCQCIGEQCPAGQGVCAKSCEINKPCACVDLSSDPKRCGGCDRQCAEGFACAKGQCVCKAPKTQCAPKDCKGPNCRKVCVDLQNDSRHCGRCGNACVNGSACAQGKCQEILLQAGSFLRGTRKEVMNWSKYQEKRDIQFWRETPPHLVTLTRPFYLGKYEVTKGWFRSLMGYARSPRPCADKKQSDRCPAHHITLYQAMEFCNKLSKQKGLEQCYLCNANEGTPQVRCRLAPRLEKGSLYNCMGYRLPTDAEWAFAVRAGTRGVFHDKTPSKLPLVFGESYKKLLDPIAWYTDNTDDFQVVGKKQPNRWGFHDMLGNVTEWTWSSESRFEYKGKPHLVNVSDPDDKLNFSMELITRGGSIMFGPWVVRNGYRGQSFPDFRNSPFPLASQFYGFRIARTAARKEICTKDALANCGEAGCRDTRRDNDHCGFCGHVCPTHQVCVQGYCQTSEININVHNDKGKAKVWRRGMQQDKLTHEYCWQEDAAFHQVQLTHDFAIERYEVRQREFAARMGFNPSMIQPCSECPVEGITWFQALAYANARSKHTGLESCYECHGKPQDKDFWCTLKAKFRSNQGKDYYTCKGYRLPTEAEWEFAALEQNQRLSACEESKVKHRERQRKEARDPERERGKVRRVGLRRPNKLGIHDMMGNVSEWVWDAYNPSYVSRNDPKMLHVNPVGPQIYPIGTYRDCSPGFSAENKRCHPAYRVMRGMNYSTTLDFHFDERLRDYQHITLLHRNKSAFLRDPGLTGMRLVRTLQ